MWLTEPALKDTRRTSSPIMEIINSASHWDAGDKDVILNKDELEFRRVSLFDVSKWISSVACIFIVGGGGNPGVKPQSNGA